MSSSVCAGDSGSDNTSSPACSATGKGLPRIALPEPCQPVHRQEVDARADQLVGESLLIRVPGRARLGRVDADDVEVQSVQVAIVTGERADPAEVG